MVTATLRAPAPGFVMVIGFSVSLCCLGNLRSKNMDASLSGSFCFELGVNEVEKDVVLIT